MAAGKGKRMNSSIPKVLHKVAGKSMLEHVIAIPERLGADPIVVVVGHNGEEIETYLANLSPDIEVVWQTELLGTGDAVKRALPKVRGKSQHVLVLCGDTPLLTYETLKHLVESHFERQPACTVLTATLEDPSGYGRVVRDSDGFVLRIVEDVDATSEEKSIKEVNAGVYVFDVELLEEGISSLSSKNNQNEYYLPETINYFVKKGYRVDAIKARDPDEIRGVNSKIELAFANRLFFLRKAYQLMSEGVTIIDPETTYIEAEVTVGRDTVINPNTHIQGRTIIGSRCEIGPNATIRDCEIGDEVTFFNSVAVESRIGTKTSVGPFAYIRPGTVIGNSSKVGTFVEIKKSVIGDSTKVPHLSYIGDTEIGSGVNVGAGCITCNYDGVEKHRTVIEDGVFLGSNTIMVAPVTIGKGAYTGAGSVITENVPPYSLAIARERQVNKERWVLKRFVKKEVTDGEKE